MDTGSRGIGAVLMLVLGAASLGLAALAKNPASEIARPAQTHVEKPPDAPPPSDPWLDASPFRLAMRTMWADPGIVVMHGRDPEFAETESIECSAEDIGRKASRFAQLYGAVAKGALDLRVAAANKRWDDAELSADRLSKACCDCHVEYWPPRLRGFSTQVIDLWRRKGPVDETPWTGEFAQRLSKAPTTALCKQMRGWNDMMAVLGAALEKQDAEAMQTAATGLHTALDEIAQSWGRVRDRAQSLQQFAMRANFAPMKQTYERMITECNNCHSGFAEVPAGFNPPPWR